MASLHRRWNLSLVLFTAVFIIFLMIYSLVCAWSYKHFKHFANLKQLQLRPQDNQTFELSLQLKSSVEVDNCTKPSNTMVNQKSNTNVTKKETVKRMNSEFVGPQMAGPHIDHTHLVCKIFLSKKQKAKENYYDINMKTKQPPTPVDNMVIYKRYPGLTFLPNYKLQSFITPDNITGLDRQLTDITKSEAELRFYSVISTLHVNCTNMQRMGNSGDGGWDICISEPYHPKNNCRVYSFGIRNDFSFDDAMGEQYGCIVRAFDPSMHVGDHMRSNRVWLYKVGLGAENTISQKGWRLKTLGTILSEANDLNNVIDVLKFDIEYSELSCLCSMFNEGVLYNVRQLVFEIHITHRSSVQDFHDISEILLEIERIGFRRFHYHQNPAHSYRSVYTGKRRTCCSELYYINTNFLQDDANEKLGES